MPYLLRYRCRIQGCPRTTRGRYCEVHQPIAQRAFDQRRGSAEERGYDRAWKKVAQHRRNLDFYLCQDCLAHGRLITSNLVDHIIPIHVRPDWRLVIDNTQVLCTICHGRKSGEDLVRYGGRGRIELSFQQRQHRDEAMQLIRPPRTYKLCTGNENGPAGG